MKRICFLIGNLNDSGGTERVTSLIANELSKQDYDVSILSLADGKDPFFELQPAVHTYSLYHKKISFKKNFVFAVWKIRKFIKHNNISTLIVVDSISCMFTVPALYGLNVNHICWEHFNFNVDLGVPFRRIGRKIAAKHCDYVVTLTRRDKELWEQGLKSIKAKIVPIPNPTPYEDINHIPSLEYKTVLAMGRLTYQKGFDLLLDAWALVCQTNLDWTLRIVGNGEDEKNLKQQAKNLNIEDRVNFLPATKNVELHYKTSSFYCLSSRFEGLPMVLLEAQAFGLPIVAFDCDTGPSDLIRHNVNGWLVENGNVESLSNELKNCLNVDEQSYKNNIENTYSFSKKFSVTEIVKRWITILEN